MVGQRAVKPTNLPTMHCYARPLDKLHISYLLQFIPMPTMNPSSMGAQRQSLAYM